MFGANFGGSSNLEQILPFWATFEQNIGLVAPRFKAQIKHEKVNDFIENFNVFNFFFIVFEIFWNFLIFFFLTDVSNYCEERKIKLLINVYVKISRNLGGNFWNLSSTFLAFQWATFQHFTSTIGKGLILGGYFL